MIERCKSLVERVAGDGQEDVEEGVVAGEGEEDEVDAELEAAAAVLDAAGGLDGSVHYVVPVLLRQHLEEERLQWSGGEAVEIVPISK